MAHGCTAAGNDQVRFEVALRTLNPGLEILAPVRDNNWVRDEQLLILKITACRRPPRVQTTRSIAVFGALRLAVRKH